MPLVVFPALLSEIDQVYDVFFAAFKDEPIMPFLYPRGVDRKAHREGTIQWSQQDKTTHIVKCVDTDTGNIVGMASWDIFWRPGEENGWERPAGIPWLEGEEKERCMSVLGPMWDIRVDLFGRRRYIYLSAVAVHPDHQRGGAGRLLIQWGIDLANQLALPIYTESSEVGFHLYEHMGFERLSHVRLIHKAEIIGKPEDVEIPLMVKMPTSLGGMGV
ncbi:conserved hypothetical protein [Histoplasma capsulatum var. duboisii H88]|uniref:N-acetyltransferase domain-containing protein n=1 Tax=Ajellomyces capsulatus (strain H88) TaxID=544711 RepID=F0URP6_AJEC8|nr:conserved hypothetical protein [Histoplasma capsulatum var. duboisii H88]QSS50580.1 hypothetical protein I7I53_11327 [Histoplasma capsulatum var. duboisii H88]